MTNLVRRLLSLLFTLKIYNKHFKLTYTGKIISWNTFYAQGHWGKRYKLTEEYHKIFKVLVKKAKVTKMEEMSFVVFYNDNKDVDNVGAMCKWLADVIKGKQIEEDDTRFYKGLMVFHDPSLPKKTMEFHIIGY